MHTTETVDNTSLPRDTSSHLALGTTLIAAAANVWRISVHLLARLRSDDRELSDIHKIIFRHGAAEPTRAPAQSVLPALRCQHSEPTLIVGRRDRARQPPPERATRGLRHGETTLRHTRNLSGRSARLHHQYLILVCVCVVIERRGRSRHRIERRLRPSPKVLPIQTIKGARLTGNASARLPGQHIRTDNRKFAYIYDELP
jgi:hypothetical protein